MEIHRGLLYYIAKEAIRCANVQMKNDVLMGK